MSNPIQITALEWAPPQFQGQVRDLAVRWALEEAGLPYEVRLLGEEARKAAGYRRLQPFGQVPVYTEGEIELFESGAIVLHIAEKPPLPGHTALLPADSGARGRARAWIFAALNSLDVHITALCDIDHWAPTEPWGIARRPELEQMVRSRLDTLAAQFKDREYLAGDFSAADIMTIMVLRALRHTTLVSGSPALLAYRERCETRPAFQRSLAAQLQEYARHAPDPTAPNIEVSP
ncbi:MAG: glutathione S-transferase family protein [Pseudomonadota bacterium]